MGLSVGGALSFPWSAVVIFMISDNADEYREMVRMALSGDANTPVLNGSLRHAQVVIEEAFKAATSKVRILTSELDSSCYGVSAVMVAAKNFLKADDAKLVILVERPADQVRNNPFLHNLEDEIASGQVEIGYVPDALSNTYGFNFMVVDDRACRFEADRRIPEAIVMGGDQGAQISLRLGRLFDGLRDSVLNARTENAVTELSPA